MFEDGEEPTLSACTAYACDFHQDSWEVISKMKKSEVSSVGLLLRNQSQ